MTICAVALTLPDSKIRRELTDLREKYGSYMNYTIEPHVTLMYPFIPKLDLVVVNKKLEAVAGRANPFSMVLNGIRYFEGQNNVAYVAIENKQPVIDLHIDIFHSLNGLVEGNKLEYTLDRFTPHLTISEHIPDEILPSIKKQLSEYDLRYEVRIASFALFSAGQTETRQTWKRTRVFEFSPLKRDIRYQGAIIRDDHILLIRHKERATGRTYWVIPGGGRNEGESPEDCVRREMKEETHLDVKVKELLFDEPEPAGDSTYRRLRTYLCKPKTGEAKAGCEPEEEAASFYSIVEVKWFDLRDESGWNPEMLGDPFTYPQVQRLRQKLGYLRRS